MSVNDVDLEAVAGLVGAIQDDPAAALTTWNSRVTWNGGFRSEARIRDFSTVRADEPPGLGGDDTAPNPVEHLLSSLGYCLAVGYAANAAVAGIELDSLDIDITGDVDLHAFLGLAEGHAGFSSITATVSIGSDATPEALAALHDKVVATSPVGHTLERPIPLAVQLIGASAGEAVA